MPATATATESVYNFDFKVVYSEYTYTFSFDSMVTIKNFIEIVKNNLSDSQMFSQNDLFELVEAGQANSERGLALNAFDNFTLKDLYENRWENVSFYIRINEPAPAFNLQ